MCALPLSVQDIGLCPTPTKPGFWSRFSALEEKYRLLWEETESAHLVPGEATSWLNRFANFRQSKRLIKILADEIRVFPADPTFQRVWRRRVEQEIQRFGQDRFGWSEGYKDLLVSEGFYETSTGFVRRARTFDPRISGSDVGQALRNVWIVNSLQMLLDLEVVLTPAVFGYSMLYPVTDNFLDDPEIGDGPKASLNRNLGLWLAGESARPTDPHQQKVQRLVMMIEDQFDRREFPSVYSSLQAIHTGQQGSLRQHDSESLCDRELVEISIRKGGASVVADGYLAAGRLGPAEEDFCMGYGVFLQLLDDLQDVEGDLETGHQTLFTSAAKAGSLETITSRLYRFMHTVVVESECFREPKYKAIKTLILRNSEFLLVGAVAESPDHFSRAFRRRIASHWPLGLRAMRWLRQRGVRAFRAAANDLLQARRSDSILDLL